MSFDRGIIVLMGSGELTGTMVELHKTLLRSFGASPQAYFVDTPAGFQLNVDQISKKAAAYFASRVQQSLRLASFKSAEQVDEAAMEQTFSALRTADYILIGPGSPTYALQQWRQSPIPQILERHIKKGGCLVAASAAALTMGRLTLPVYEIYKVGEPVHWVNGLDLLGHFGMNLVVFPHWNNAEGGNHDTRYCFMGAQRLQHLEKQMPPASQILGLDEHTALVIDFAQSKATVHGVGRVVLKKKGKASIFVKGNTIPLALLQGDSSTLAPTTDTKTDVWLEKTAAVPQKERALWNDLHHMADNVRTGLEQKRYEHTASLLLKMEHNIWQARDLLEEIDGIGAARALFREMIALLANQITEQPPDHHPHLQPLVKSLLVLRSQFRKDKKWTEADALRHCLQAADIEVADTPQGPRWQTKKCRK